MSYSLHTKYYYNLYRAHHHVITQDIYNSTRAIHLGVDVAICPFAHGTLCWMGYQIWKNYSSVAYCYLEKCIYWAILESKYYAYMHRLTLSVCL